jgi:hypothetical protein
VAVGGPGDPGRPELVELGRGAVAVLVEAVKEDEERTRFAFAVRRWQVLVVAEQRLGLADGPRNERRR